MRTFGIVALTAVALSGSVALAPAATAANATPRTAVLLKAYSAKSHTITVEAAQVYTGKAATRFAATHRAYWKQLTCGTNQTPYTGKQDLRTCSVMDDSLLVQDPKHSRRTLHLNANTRIDLLKNRGGGPELHRAKEAELAGAAKATALVWVTADKRGSVSRITEQYLP